VNTMGVIQGLALDASESRIVVAANGGEVAQIEVAGNVLTLVRQWNPPMFSDSNCFREPFSSIFDHSGTRFATFDSNCGAFDIYDYDSGSLDMAASVRFERPPGGTASTNIVLDALGQIWTGNVGIVYRTGMTDPSRQATVSFVPMTGLWLTVNGAGDTVYVFTADARVNGVFALDVASGTKTQLPWNLDLVPSHAVPSRITFVSP
jgi:hypothetical protein